MATNTARLLLQKPDPDPVTGDFLDVSVLNSNFDKIDAGLGAEPVTSSTLPTGAARYNGKFIRETDTGLLRLWDGANWLQIPNVNAAGTHIILSGMELNLTRAAATDTVLYGQATGDTVGRLLIRANGSLEFGPGNAARDVNLYRGSVGNLLRTDDAFQAGGFCSGAGSESVRTSTIGSITTTETLLQSVTFNAISGAGYMVSAVQHFQSTIANDVGIIRLRWASGATVTAAGTIITAIYPNADIAGRGQPSSLSKLFTPNVTGQVTVGVFMVRDIGTGTISSNGIAGKAENLLTVVGA